MNQEVLGDNIGFIGKRETLRKWFKRTQTTLYFRKRAKKATTEWHCKIMRTCFEAIKSSNKTDSKFMRKMIQVIKRNRNLDLAKAF